MRAELARDAGDHESISSAGASKDSMKPAKRATQLAEKDAPASSKKFTGFMEEERAAMKERVRELKDGEEGGEAAVLAKIAVVRKKLDE